MRFVWKLLLYIILVFGTSYPGFAQDVEESILSEDDLQDEEYSPASDEFSAIRPKPISPFLGDHRLIAKLYTTQGELCCDLFVQDHPMTVLNFILLAGTHLPWMGKDFKTFAFYEDLPFHRRRTGGYVASGRDESGKLDYHIVDERCEEHGPVAGAIGMIQNHPSSSMSEFFILAKDMSHFEGMFPIFGQCQPLEIIEKLSNHESRLERVVIVDSAVCPSASIQE